MINVPKYNKENRRKDFELLPPGVYVCKIMAIEEQTSKKGKAMVKISFDIAEGEYKDFYANQYRNSTSEDKHWNYDATFFLTIPYDGCEAYITTNWDSFWADVEDSNNGFVFQGDEGSVINKTFGAQLRNEQDEYNGNIYDHTKFYRSKIAQDVRDGKVKPAKDKLVEQAAAPADSSGFMQIVPDVEDLPFGTKKN